MSQQSASRYSVRMSKLESIHGKLTLDSKNCAPARLTSPLDRSPAINTSRYTLLWFCLKIRKRKKKADLWHIR